MFLKQVLQAGNLVGQAADGATGVVGGILSQDNKAIDYGFEEIGDAAAKTIVGVVSGVGNIAKNTIEVADYLDIVGTDGIDDIDDVDMVEHDADIQIEEVSVTNLQLVDDMDDVGEAGNHFVEPHYVDSYVRADGTVVEGYWRDGDGNTAINIGEENGGGYMRSNPKRL